MPGTTGAESAENREPKTYHRRRTPARLGRSAPVCQRRAKSGASSPGGVHSARSAVLTQHRHCRVRDHDGARRDRHRTEPRLSPIGAAVPPDTSLWLGQQPLQTHENGGGPQVHPAPGGRNLLTNSSGDAVCETDPSGGLPRIVRQRLPATGPAPRPAPPCFRHGKPRIRRFHQPWEAFVTVLTPSALTVFIRNAGTAYSPLMHGKLRTPFRRFSRREHHQVPGESEVVSRSHGSI